MKKIFFFLILMMVLAVFAYTQQYDLGSDFNRFFEVLRPLADIMSEFETLSVQDRRDEYDDILEAALSSQPAIVRIFSVWKPNAIDFMDRRYIGRPGSTDTGQYAPAFSRENGAIEKSTFADLSDSMTYLNGTNSRKERVDQPVRLTVNGHDVYVFRLWVPIINPRTNEVVGTVGCYCDVR